MAAAVSALSHASSRWPGMPQFRQDECRDAEQDHAACHGDRMHAGGEGVVAPRSAGGVAAAGHFFGFGHDAGQAFFFKGDIQFLRSTVSVSR